jgi:hypothetical protein
MQIYATPSTGRKAYGAARDLPLEEFPTLARELTCPGAWKHQV